MAAVIGIVSGCGFSIDPCHRNQSSKCKLVFYTIMALLFTGCYYLEFHKIIVFCKNVFAKNYSCIATYTCLNVFFLKSDKVSSIPFS